MSDQLAVIQSEETIKELQEIKGEVSHLIKTFNDLVKVTDQVSSGLMKGTPKEAINAMSAMEKQAKGYLSIQKEVIRIDKEATIIANKQADTLYKKAKATEVAERAELQRARTQAVNMQTAIREEQHRERGIKALEREQAKLAAAESLYHKVEIKLKTLQNEYKNLATAKDLGIKMTDKEIQRMNHLEAKIKKYDTTLKAVDATMGKYQRNVGNYASAFNPLSNSINQLTREAPAFANSMQTGFMAISNNLPTFFDAIKQVNEQNKQLKANGQATVPVWKQLAQSVFSLNTLLSVSVTLLTIYGADIVKWGTNLIKGKQGVDKLAESQEALNKAFKDTDYKNAVKNVAEMRTNFDLAKKGVMDKGEVLKKYNDTLGKVMGTAKDLNEAEMLLANNADRYIKATLYKAAANLAMEKASQKIVEAHEKQQEIEKGGYRFTLFGDDGSGSAANNQAKVVKEKRQKELDKIEKDRKAQEDIAKDLLTKSAELGKGLNLETGVEMPKAKKEKDNTKSKISQEKRDAIDRLNAERDNSLALLKEKQLRGEITEKAYWEGRMKAIKTYADKVTALLNSKNAKEGKLSAEVRKKAVEEQERAYKEIYDYEEKALKIREKNLQDSIKNQTEIAKNDENSTEVERIKKLQEINQEEINKTKELYDEKLKLAQKYRQSEEETMNEANAKIQELEREKLELIKEMHPATLKDIENNQKLLEALQGQTYERQKATLLADKSLSNANREFMLKILELENQKKINEEKIRGLKLIEAEYTAKEKLTQGQEIELANIRKNITELENTNTGVDIQIKQVNLDKVLSDLAPIKNALTDGLKNLGLDSVADEFGMMFNAILANADQFGKEFESESQKWTAVAMAGLSLLGDFGKKLIEEGTKKEIEEIDKQIQASKETSEKELSVIDKRLNALNNLSTLTAEQEAERRALEDEAFVIKEQQAEKEKMLEAQKARAQQKAQAQQALMNGALAATMSLAQQGFPAGLISAAAAIAFAGVQSALIMSKNPVPQYFKGTRNAPKGWAWTDERGAEIHTDKYGNIKDFGSDKGARLKYLEQGDKIYTASETRRFLEQIQTPNLEEALLSKNIIKNIQVPMNINQPSIDYDKLAQKIGEQQERIARKYDKANVYELNGVYYMEKGGKIPQIVGRVRKDKNIIKIKGNERN